MPTDRRARTPARTGDRRGILTLAGWLGSLLVGVALFSAVGQGPLEAPPLTDPSAWAMWASERDALVATMAMLRLVVLALAWYLVGVTTIGVIARCTRAARLVRLADALTVPAVRRLLQGALGLGLATAMVGASLPGVARPFEGQSRGAQQEAPTDAAALRLALAPASGDRASRLTAGDAPAAELRLRRADPLPLELLTGGDGIDAAGRTEGQDPVSHEVRSGESFWSIARALLEDAWDRSPSDADVHDYWQDLIELNRARLVVQDNPDLLLPGQELLLPEAPEAS